MIIDSHAHLDDPDFAPDFPDVLARAAAAGIERIVTIGTSLASSRRAVELAEKFPNVFAVIGVHPTEADEAESGVIESLRELAKNPRVAAIGEIGLDYHHLPSAKILNPVPGWLAEMPLNDPQEITANIHDGAYKSTQAVLFEQQLDLAAELGLNVVIHQREAWDDTLDILKNYTGKVRGVFHCFGGPFAQAAEVIELGHLVSFTGIITFKNAPLVRECAARVRAGDFMVETDCPYLAPVPFRGKRCEPAHTRLVAEKIAELRGVTREEIAQQTTQTAHDFFRFERN